MISHQNILESKFQGQLETYWQWCLYHLAFCFHFIVASNCVVLTNVIVHHSHLQSSGSLWIVLHHSVLIIKKYDTVWALLMINILGTIGFCAFYGLQTASSCTISIKYHNNESRKCTNTGSRNRGQCGYDNIYTLSLRVFMCNHKSVIKPLIQTANLLKYKSHKLSDFTTPMHGLCLCYVTENISMLFLRGEFHNFCELDSICK